VQPRSGASELAFLGDRKKIAQMSQFHRTSGIGLGYGNCIRYVFYIGEFRTYAASAGNE
jgi:hypothetical protein